MAQGANYSGSAGNTTSLNGGTFLQSTAGVSGSYATGVIAATIGTFGPAGSEQIGSVQILVNGSVTFTLPVDFIDPGNNGIVVVGGNQSQWSSGSNLSNISLVGKTVSGRVSVNGFGPAAVVSFSLSNPANPPSAPGGFSGLIGQLFGFGAPGVSEAPDGSIPSDPLGRFDLGTAPDGDLLAPAAGPDPDYTPYVYPDSPPMFPPDPVEWPNASFTFSDTWGRGGPAAAAVRKAKELAAQRRAGKVACLRLKSRNYINTASIALPVNLPIAIQLDNSMSVTAKWLKVSPGLYNQAASGGNSKLGIRVYRGLLLSGARNTWVSSPSTGFGLAPEWVGVSSYPDLIPWDGVSQFVVELTGSDPTIPAASFFECVIEGFDN